MLTFLTPIFDFTDALLAPLPSNLVEAIRLETPETRPVTGDWLELSFAPIQIALSGLERYSTAESDGNAIATEEPSVASIEQAIGNFPPEMEEVATATLTADDFYRAIQPLHPSWKMLLFPIQSDYMADMLGLPDERQNQPQQNEAIAQPDIEENWFEIPWQSDKGTFAIAPFPDGHIVKRRKLKKGAFELTEHIILSGGNCDCIAGQRGQICCHTRALDLWKSRQEFQQQQERLQQQEPSPEEVEIARASLEPPRDREQFMVSIRNEWMRLNWGKAEAQIFVKGIIGKEEYKDSPTDDLERLLAAAQTQKPARKQRQKPEPLRGFEKGDRVRHADGFVGTVFIATTKGGILKDASGANKWAAWSECELAASDEIGF